MKYLLWAVFAIGYILSIVLNKSLQSFHPVHFVFFPIIVAGSVGMLFHAVTHQRTK